ncbi:MFS transporter [Planctomycetota bacterium]|nr:MFS transporter [Planctomycetota bacterium]
MTQSMAPSAQPYMTRQSYRQELITVMLFPLAISLFEGSVITVLAKMVFDVGWFAFATMMAAPMFANLTSFAWTRLAKGRRKVSVIASLQATLLVCLIAVALLPVSPLGGLLLVCFTVLSRCCLAGVATLRSTVWRQNYPRRSRAKITSKLVLITSLVLALGPIPIYKLLEYDETLYRPLYIAVAVIAAIGVFAYSRIRLREEKQLLNHERRDKKDIDSSEPSATFLSVLKNDKFYRHYMTWQFFAGVGNMMGETAIIALIIHWVRQDNSDWITNYRFVIPVILSATIPMIVATLTIPLWARYMDRVHITRFRTKHAYTWVFAQFGYWVIGMMGPAMWPLVALPRIVQGLARSGGLLAWNLGHNDFADKRLVTTYMGIHVTLTGVRGLFSPYLAVLLLFGWEGSWLSEYISFSGIEHHIFLITTVFCLIAQAGFFWLDRMYKKQKEAENKYELKDQEKSTAVD